jgi:hypothetical protein
MNMAMCGWPAALTNGCGIEVYVRAADERPALGSAVFVAVTNHVSFPSIRGRYIEVRLGMTREEAAQKTQQWESSPSGVILLSI